MFTNNYIQFKNAIFYGKKVEVKACNGSGFTQDPNRADTPDIGAIMKYGRCGIPVEPRTDHRTSSTFSSYSYYSESTLYPGVYFGTGNTPASKADYKLESPIESGLAITNCGVTSLPEGDGKYTVAASFVLANTSELELNIYEIGLFGMCAYSTYSNYTHYGSAVLFDRVVLAEPITVPVGGSKLVTYKITFNQTLQMEEA